ncbi:MAG: AsmA family protein, partial [Candidatus Gastranaerophilales bacterium]|nr:AsmA family protein [Candidatus Gastranaerophilales bacterium]
MFQVKKICTGIGICAVSVGALYFAALISIPCFVDLNRYKEPVISEIEKQTGLKVTCENISFKRSLSPYFRVNLFHTMVMYPDSEVFLKLKEIDLKIKIFPLLLKKIIIKDAVFQRPIINITLYKDLTTSLEHLIPEGKSINTGGHNLVSPAFFDDSSSPKNWGSPFQGATQKFRSRSLSRNFLGHFQIEGTVYNTLLYDYKLKIKDESIKKEFYFEGGELVLSDIKLNDKMHFVLKGALYESGNEYLKYDLDILMPLKENRHVLFSPFKYIYESDIKGEVYGHIKYQSADNVTGSIKINDLSLRTGKTKIDNNNFSVIFEGAQAKFEALIHSSKTDIVKLNGNLGFGKNKFINCSAYAKNVNLENLYNVASAISDIMNLKINLHDYKISGLIDADFNINSDFKKLTSSGHALFSNAKISHKQLPYKITDINADINFNNNKVQILKAAANINQTPLNIKGQINEDVSYKIEVFSKDLNLNKLTELFKLKLPFLVLNGNLSFESSLEGILYKSFFVKTKALINNLKLKEADKNIIITADSAQVDFDGNEKKFNGNSRIDKISINIPRQSILISAIKLLFDENNITI